MTASSSRPVELSTYLYTLEGVGVFWVDFPRAGYVATTQLQWTNHTSHVLIISVSVWAVLMPLMAHSSTTALFHSGKARGEKLIFPSEVVRNIPAREVRCVLLYFNIQIWISSSRSYRVAHFLATWKFCWYCMSGNTARGMCNIYRQQDICAG